MQNKIVIVDYGMGNLRSVEKKMKRVGAEVIISNKPEAILNSQKIILPGVGHFANGVIKLKQLGFWEVLQHEVLNNKKPILGICLGMQLMTKQSEEGNVQGFGWIDAEVVRFKVSDKLKYKIPHIGWNDLKPDKKNSILNNVDFNQKYYFVHSYHAICYNKQDILTTTQYDYDFVSAFCKDNIFGFQFHPEKSHEQGEQILKNFIQI